MEEKAKHEASILLDMFSSAFLLQMADFSAEEAEW
jgi:hypothetical protein